MSAAILKLRQRIIEFAAPILLCMALLTAYFVVHEGVFASAVFGVLLLTMVGLGALLGVLMLLLPTCFANLLLALALLFFLDVHFGISGIIATWTSVNLDFVPQSVRQAVGMLVLLAPLLVPAWKLDQSFSLMVAGAMLVFFISSLMQPVFWANRPVSVTETTDKAPAQPGNFVLHIVLDELAAPETVSPYLTDGPAYEAEFKNFFARHGFQLATHHKVPFNLTGFAIPALLNSMPDKTPTEQLTRQWQLPFKQFTDWKNAGYAVHVIGVDFVSPCQGENMGLVDSCTLFPAFSLLPILTSDYSTAAKSALVLERLLWGSGLVQRACKAIGAHCASNLNAPMSWYALDQIAAIKHILESKSGDIAIFAHILAPHLPLYFDRDCRRNYRRSDEVLNNRDRFYSAYADQSLCVLDTLEPILQSVQMNARSVDIIIQGDHGLRVPMVLDIHKNTNDADSFLTVRAKKSHSH